jgi:transposase
MKKYTWVGIDDDARMLDVAVYEGFEEEPCKETRFSRDERGMGRLVKMLKELPGQVRCVYEAGPCGYTLQRELSARGIRCDVAAPSKTPRKAGERVKTNRLDARKLARLYRSAELTMITVPDEQHEALRDLVRAREVVREDVLRWRHRIAKLLLRYGYRYERTAWTQAHLRWIDQIRLSEVHTQMVLDEYKAGLRIALEQLHRFDEQVDVAARGPENARFVEQMSALRGIGTISAMTIKAELGDLKRYASAGQMMAAVGLVPSEFSTGTKRRQGAITKTGNAHVRHVLVEGAWQYRHRPSLRSKVARRRKTIDNPEVIAIAEKADGRLHRKYWKLVHRGKRSTVAAVAVAREMAGFVWAIGQTL